MCEFLNENTINPAELSMMSVPAYDMYDEMFLMRRSAPSSVKKNRNKSCNPKLLTPQPRRFENNPNTNPAPMSGSAPPTPLKSSKSPVSPNKSPERLSKSRSSTASKRTKSRNSSASPDCKFMEMFGNSTPYDEPIDLAVPSMTNLPPVRSNSAVDAHSSPCSALPPLPNDMVFYDIVFQEESLTTNISPAKEPEFGLDLPPVPDNLIVMAVEN